jgi:hypothetical protein
MHATQPCGTLIPPWIVVLFSAATLAGLGLLVFLCT